MNSVMKTALLSLVVFAVIVLLGGRNITGAESGLSCKGEGAWTATDPSGYTWKLLITPLDKTMEKMGVSVTPVNFDPTLGGAFPDVVTLTPLNGVIELADDNLIDYQWVGYGLGADREIIYSLRSRGTLEFLDCETVEGSGSLGFYGSWQDPFGEEAPAFGCFPSVSLAVRDPMVEPCVY